MKRKLRYPVIQITIYKDPYICLCTVFRSNSPNMNKHIREESPGLISPERIVYKQSCSRTTDRWFSFSYYVPKKCSNL